MKSDYFGWVCQFMTRKSYLSKIAFHLIFYYNSFLQEDIKSLTAHVIENYWKALEDVDYVQTFKGLKLRFEQQRERQDNPKLDR